MVLEGYAEQGVDWKNWGRWGTFNFYANLDYIADTEEIEWNNKIAMGAGIKLKKLVGSNLLLQYGIEATREHYWETDESLNVVFAYLNWSAWWDPRAVRHDSARSARVMADRAGAGRSRALPARSALKPGQNRKGSVT
jgi:hypothetical protein